MINTQRLITFCALFGVLLLQGCFDVVEQATLHADGSGDFQLVLNLSRSKTKINSLLKMKTVNGHPVPTREEISKKVADLEKKLQQTSGISNVKTRLDFDNYIATLTCSFDKVSSLNNAIKSISGKSDTQQKGLEKSYDYDIVNKVFSRLNKFELKKEYDKMSNADKEVFATANYTGIFRFETAVNTFSNPDAKLSADKKAIMLKENVLDVIMNKKQIENKITLSK
ncbi:MAG: hypothetical protein QM802_06355 [Agriterribacter sp.]